MLAATAPSVRAAELPLIPLPAKVEAHSGTFALNDQTVLVADAAFTNEAALLAEEMHLPPAPAVSQNYVRLTTHGSDGLGDEAYRLEINQQGATIHAASAAGAFYGAQTLRQLLNAQTRTLPCVTITDAPRYPWRGLMLDVSRHFFDKPTILRLLDTMAGYKLNRFHLHLTDDPGWRLEITQYPELTRTGARGNYSDSNAPARFLSRDDIRQIVAYAQARHIVVVPEIDMPGHASAATRAYPQLDGGVHTFNPARPETYNFLENVLLEVMTNFPSPWIHIGGDEVNCAVWNNDPQVAEKMQTEGLKEPQQLEQSFMRDMARFVRDHGRSPACWDEVTTAGPVQGTTIFWWRHNKPDVLAEALADGYSVVLTPRAPCYFDYPQDKSFPTQAWKLYNTLADVYRGPVIPETIPAGRRRQILGVEGCLWTERISTTSYLEFMTLPRLAALAEMTWTPDRERNFARFDTRLKPFLTQYRAAGIHFYDEADPTGSFHEARQTDGSSPDTGVNESATADKSGG